MASRPRGSGTHGVNLHRFEVQAQRNRMEAVSENEAPLLGDVCSKRDVVLHQHAPAPSKCPFNAPASHRAPTDVQLQAVRGLAVASCRAINALQAPAHQWRGLRAISATAVRGMCQNA